MPVENLIHIIRGQQVMIDSDLARLYGVETKRLNEQVKRNIDRFPEDFMFQLTKSESEDLRSQIATLKQGHNIKYQPYAFTENGVVMLSSVLRSKAAIEVNIRIMRAFTAMRSFMMSNAHIFQRLETVEHNYLLVNRHLSEQDRKFEELGDYLTLCFDITRQPLIPLKIIWVAFSLRFSL
ncbi:MAG: ORF6N domain-containing protein [Muribaculaceae bacterium]|nr:ORF6N domain-containing protein [Muribaculaceae bacterium]